MKFSEYPDREMMMLGLANILAGELADFTRREGRASFCVPGGTTPGPIFDSLCAVDIDWSRVDIMLTDERWVPESSERSNTRLLRQRLLTNRAAAAHLVPLYAEAATPEEKLAELEAGVAATLPLSVVLLGMGLDMHTASIFPGADRLEDALTGPALLVPMRAPGAPEPRITLSAAVLNGAMSRHIVITGAAKREAFERAKGLTPAEAPVAAVLKGAFIHWAEN